MATGSNKSEDHQIEILEDDDTEISLEDMQSDGLPLLSIESNLGADIESPPAVGDSVHRGSKFSHEML